MENEVVKCIIENSNGNFDWADFFNAIMAITGLINLGLVIFIFKKEQKENLEKSKHQKKTEWYDSLKLKDLAISFTQELDNLKVKIIEYYDDKLERNEFIKEYKNFEKKFLKFKNEYITIIECVDCLKTNNLTNWFQKIQDQSYKMMTRIVGENEAGFEKNVQEKIIFFEKVKKSIIKTSIKLYN